MAQPEKTEPLPVCVDTDVLIAGLLSRTGASHAILVLGELRLLRLMVPAGAVAEIRRNLTSKLPEAAPFFEEFLCAVPLQIYRPTVHDRERAGDLADAKDVPILAAAIGAGARLLFTRMSGTSVRVRECASGAHGRSSKKPARDGIVRNVRSRPRRAAHNFAGQLSLRKV